MKIPAPLKPFAFAVLRALPPIERRVIPSAGYRRISRDGAKRLQTESSGWKSNSSAAWQQRAYETLLRQMRAGAPRRDLQVAAAAIDAAGIAAPNVLEVGAGGGYHSVIFAELCQCNPSYLGTDYSEEMLANARERFPGVAFELADTTALPFGDDAFDIVFEGVSLMHILNYRKAIAEVARAARSHAIFHCVPVFEDHETEYLFKYAYGQPVTEAVFNRAEIEREFKGAGLVIEQSWHALAYDVRPITGHASHARTYLCRKTAG